MTEFRFSGSEQKVSRLGFLSRTGFVFALLLIAFLYWQEDKALFLLTICCFLLIAGAIFCGVYILYYNLILKYDVEKQFFVINEKGLEYLYQLIPWTNMKQIHIKYVTHHFIWGYPQCYSNSISFVVNNKKREFHFLLHGEEDKLRYLNMLEMLYGNKISFIEEMSTIGRTFLMNSLSEEQKDDFLSITNTKK